MTVKLGVLPDQNQGSGPANPRGGEDSDVLSGVTVRELTPHARSLANLPEDMEGLLVTAVSPSSNAASEGLAQGDVIQEVNRVKVTNLAELKEALKRSPERPIFMRVYKPRSGGQGGNVFIAVPR